MIRLFSDSTKEGGVVGRSGTCIVIQWGFDSLRKWVSRCQEAARAGSSLWDTEVGAQSNIMTVKEETLPDQSLSCYAYWEEQGRHKNTVQIQPGV